jgi:hypothetical protein
MRIRSIKPDFYTSEDIAALDWDARLVFIGLWSYVDDNGVGRDNERLIVADLFPLEEDPREALAKVSRALELLETRGQITRYEVDGNRYVFVNAWDKHQKVDRPNKVRYPRPTSENVPPARSSRDPRDSSSPGAVEQGNRGTEERSSVVVVLRLTRGPNSDDDDEQIARWQQKHPDLDLAERAESFLEANARNRDMQNPMLMFNRWLETAPASVRRKPSRPVCPDCDGGWRGEDPETGLPIRCDTCRPLRSVEAS